MAFHALILGQGEREADVRRRIADAGLQGDVTLCGFQANPWKFMARADVFVLTSDYEGFGNVLVEAMACGAPVVATASPGTRAIVEPGVNGVLVESHEAPAVADAIARAARPHMAQRLSAGARARSRAFSAATITAAYHRVFQRLGGEAV